MAEERLLGVWEAGEFISEMILMNLDGQFTTIARAVDQVQLIEMTRKDFDDLLRRQPGLAYEIVKSLSLRINASQDRVVHDLQERNNQLKLAYEELKAAQIQIIEKERMESELKVAHNIQMSILPHSFPHLDGYDFGALVSPMHDIGGDFYDFIPLGENRLGIAIGDVSGHGVPAALFMGLTVTLLRAEACRNCSPAEVLASVNSQLRRWNAEGMFVTIFYGVLNISSGEFDYVRAGHQLPIFYSSMGSMVEMCLEPGQPLGLFNTPILTAQTINLNNGGTLLLYTDGVTEALSPNDEVFGEKRLIKAVKKFYKNPAQEICERIFKQVMTHRGDAAQSDDVTLVCIQVKRD